MPHVKLTIRAEPMEVDDAELAALRGQNLVEHVYADADGAREAAATAAQTASGTAPAAGAAALTPGPAEGAGQTDETDPAADAAGEKE